MFLSLKEIIYDLIENGLLSGLDFIYDSRHTGVINGIVQHTDNIWDKM